MFRAWWTFEGTVSRRNLIISVGEIQNTGKINAFDINFQNRGRMNKQFYNVNTKRSLQLWKIKLAVQANLRRFISGISQFPIQLLYVAP